MVSARRRRTQLEPQHELHTLCLSGRATVTIITRATLCSNSVDKKNQLWAADRAEANPKKKTIQKLSRTDQQPRVLGELDV